MTFLRDYLTRRRALQLLVATASCNALGSEVAASESCEPAWQGEICTSELDIETFAAEVAEEQYQSMWCWAACTSMIFRHHGFDISQEQIVEAEYGAKVNWPAQTGWRMTKQLNREWETSAGIRFKSKTKTLFDLEYGINKMSNFDVVSALKAGHPLLVGTMGHAVVQLGFKYFRFNDGAIGNQYNEATVFDPWPGRGLRQLTFNEKVTVSKNPFAGLHYVAWAEITEL